MAVSLALRGQPGVSPATRMKVHEVAKELGYEPDPELAKLLARIRSRVTDDTGACMALLTSGTSPDAWRNSVTERKYVEGARARAKEYGYHIDEFWISEPGMSEARLSNIIWSRGIEGVIVAPLQGRLQGEPSRAMQHIDFDLFYAVEISETVRVPELDRSVHDQYTSMFTVLDELVSFNYQAVGLVLEEALDQRVNGKWTAAYLRYRHRLGTSKMPPPLIMPTPKQAVFDRWFDHYRPDVIISVDRFGLHFLKTRGLDIPGEVGYASLDCDGDAPEYPDVSGIDQNSDTVGAAAVDMLIAGIQRGQTGIPAHPRRTEIEGSWTPGKSTLRRPTPPA